MENTVYISSNGLIMVKSEPLNWQRMSVYANSEEEPYFYSIYVGSISSGHFCNYQDGFLTISFMAYGSEDPNLIFKVSSLEEAGEIVEKFAKGMNCSLENTIYTDIN